MESRQLCRTPGLETHTAPRHGGPRAPPTVNRVALVVAESSGCSFFPASTPFRCFRTSLLSTQWNRRTKRPWREGQPVRAGTGPQDSSQGPVAAGRQACLPENAQSTATNMCRGVPRASGLLGPALGPPSLGPLLCSGERGQGSQKARGQEGPVPGHSPQAICVPNMTSLARKPSV